MNLSPNFTLQEFLESETADRLGIDNTLITAHQMYNIKHLVTEVLQPLRDRVGPIKIISGYRCAQLNKEVRGSLNSHHMCRELYAAADIVVQHMSPKMLSNLIWAMGLPVDQCIIEPGWLHVSARRPRRHFTIIGA